MKNEHKDLIVASLKEKNDLLQEQSEALLQADAVIEEQSKTLLKAQGLIDRQSKVVDDLMEKLIFATKVNGEMAHRIAELMADHQLVSLIKPVNSWIN